MSAKAAPKPTARERLLNAADELFYSEGVQSVGIDRIIEHAGVAKASLYNTFGSKEELVRAYLGSRHANSAARITAVLERYSTPRERLLAVFDAQTELFESPTFHGCAFVSASAEARAGGTVEQAADEYRGWMRTTLTDLARDAGAPDPAMLARQFHLLYDGAMLSARMDRVSSSAADAKAAAALLIDAALGSVPVNAAANAETAPRH